MKYAISGTEKFFDTIDEVKASVADQVARLYQDFELTLKNPTDRKFYTTADEYGQYEPFADFEIRDEDDCCVDEIVIDYASYIEWENENK